MNSSRNRYNNINSINDNSGRQTELEKIIEFSRRHRGLGLYLYLYYLYSVTKDGVTLSQIHSFYNKMVGRAVARETVKNQLKLLINKGLLIEKNGKYYPIPVPEDVLAKLFDLKRSENGKKGALKRLRQIIYDNQMPAVKSLPESLKHYVRVIIEKARELVKEGRREAALDLLAHTLLPLRETGVLWLWRGDEFIYYERKIMREGVFHSVRFPALARLLKELGFQEGIMVHHILGHEESRQLIDRIFSKEHLSWPWARSFFYKLKQLGFAEEGNYYIVELEHKDLTLLVYFRDYYGNLLKEYLMPWFNEKQLPPPLFPRENKS